MFIIIFRFKRFKQLKAELKNLERRIIALKYFYESLYDAQPYVKRDSHLSIWNVLFEML